jgi:hypothetical protein
MTGIPRIQQENERQAPGREIICLPVTEITATSAGAAQTLLTVPDDAFFHVGAFKVCNHTGSAVTFTMHIVPSGGSAGDANTIYSAESIPANDTVTLAERNTLMAPQGSTFAIHAGSANDLTIIMYGVLITSGDPL